MLWEKWPQIRECSWISSRRPPPKASFEPSFRKNYPWEAKNNLNRRRHARLYLHGPHPLKTMVLNDGLHPLRTMVLKIPALAPGYRKVSIEVVAEGDFQDHGSEGVQTMVPDHGFERVGTMQVQAIMPPLTQKIKITSRGCFYACLKNRGQKAHPKSRNTTKTPCLHELFPKVRANFCLLPCDTSQQPDGDCSEKLVQMTFLFWVDFFGWIFLL